MIERTILPPIKIIFPDRDLSVASVKASFINPHESENAILGEHLINGPLEDHRFFGTNIDFILIDIRTALIDYLHFNSEIIIILSSDYIVCLFFHP